MKYRMANSKNWIPCFAFIPRITEDNEIIWLAKIEKKRFHCPLPNVIPSSWTIYRIARKNNKENLHEWDNNNMKDNEE